MMKLENISDLKSDGESLAGSNPARGIILLSGPTGPYKHGYLICRVKYPNGKIKMVTYQKFLYEQAFGELPKGVMVHHKDENKNNYNLSNLEALTNKEHGSHHSSKETWELECILCNTKFKRKAIYERDNRKDKSGPFCSRQCSGKWSKMQQLGHGLK